MKTATLYWLLLILLITGVVSEATVINVEEGQNFILECFWPNKDLTFNLFDWKQDGDVEVFMYDAGVHYNNGRSGQDPRFQGRVSHFPEALKDGNASIQIRSAKVKDSGTYTCYFPRADPKRSTKIEVQVGASPKPRLYTAPATPDSLWLFCEVDGAFPEPKVEFLDGAGTRILPEKNQSLVKNGRYHIEASIHVTKTDNFTCVVTQEQIHHRTSASTFVLTCSPFSSPPPQQLLLVHLVQPPDPSACCVFQEVTRPPWTPNTSDCCLLSSHLFFRLFLL